MVLEKWKSREDLLNDINPDKQTYFLSNQDEAITCDLPTLRLIDLTYGEGTATAWLMAQVYSVSEYCGCKDKMTHAQIEGVSRDIAAYYKGLKTSELMLFFSWFKMGRYGHFYGAVDPMVLTSALYKFNEERKAMETRIESANRYAGVPKSWGDTEEDYKRAREQSKAFVDYKKTLKYK